MRYFGVVILVVAAAALLIGVCWLIASATKTPTMRLVKQATALKREASRQLTKGNVEEARMLARTADQVLTMLKDM